MTWLISILIAIGIILAIAFFAAVYIGITWNETWAKTAGVIIVCGLMFAGVVVSIHSLFFG